MEHPNVVLVRKMWDCLKAVAGYGDGSTSRSSADESLRILRTEIFTSDFQYHMPGQHPLAGTKNGAEEVIAFFSKMGSQSGLLQDGQKINAYGEDGAVEVHHAHGGAKGASLDIINCFTFKIREGRIATIRVYNNAQHQVNNYFNAIYVLKPLPDRLAP